MGMYPNTTYIAAGGIVTRLMFANLLNEDLTVCRLAPVLGNRGKSREPKLQRALVDAESASSTGNDKHYW